MDSQLSDDFENDMVSMVLNGMKSVFNNTSGPKKTFTKKNATPKQIKSVSTSVATSMGDSAEPADSNYLMSDNAEDVNSEMANAEIDNIELNADESLINNSAILMSEFYPNIVENTLIIETDDLSSCMQNVFPNDIIEAQSAADNLINDENLEIGCVVRVTENVTGPDDSVTHSNNFETPSNDSAIMLQCDQIHFVENLPMNKYLESSVETDDLFSANCIDILESESPAFADMETAESLTIKPRIVLKFRSEKSGLRSSNMKIVSDEKCDEETEPADTGPRSSRSRGHSDLLISDLLKKEIKIKTPVLNTNSEILIDSKCSTNPNSEPDYSPVSLRKKRSTAANPSDSNSEDSPPLNSDRNSVKRSARRRSREFCDNVLANAIARKEKINNEAIGHTRLSRRIKPTAKVLANRELRLGLETQNNARLGLVPEKIVPDEGKITRSKVKKSPDKIKSDGIMKSPNEKGKAKKINKLITDDDKVVSGNKTESGKSPEENKKVDSEDEVVTLQKVNKSKGKHNEDDKRINKLKKKHLKKLGLKAVTEQPKKIVLKEKENVTDESTMDSINTDAIIEHLNNRNIKSTIHPKIPDFSKNDEAPLIHTVKKFRSTKTVKRKLSLSDSEDSVTANKESDESNDDDEDVPIRITRKRSKMNNSNDPDKTNTSNESNDSSNIISCYCKEKSNIFADPDSITEPQFCRAIEFVGGRTIGCGRLVTSGRLVRSGPRAPFILACNMHHHRLSLHQSCAGCGIFCTQGTCYECSEGHLFHLECGLPFVSIYINSGQLDQSISLNCDQTSSQPRGTGTDVYNSEPGCPHCGWDSSSLEPVNTNCFKVELEMKCSNPMILLPSPRLQWTPAFMSFSSNVTSKVILDNNLPEELSILPNNLLELLKESMEKINLKRGNLIDYDDIIIEANSERQNMNLIKAVCEKENTIDNIVTAINSGADPRKHISQVDEGTFLHLAARELNLSAIYIFRTLGCDLNDYDVEHRTPLMLAVMNYDTEIGDKEDIADKMDITYDKNDFDKSNITNSQLTNLEDCEENSIPQSPTSNNKIDTLHKELVGHQREYRLVIDYLLKAGSDISLKGPNGATILHLAAKYGDTITCSHILNSNSKTARTIINQKDDGGWTPLVWAVENKSNSVVRFLLNCNADSTLKDSDNNIALHWAASAGSSTILEDLLNYGSNVNALNINGDTPLHLSARQNHYNCVIILLARGAQINIKNSEGDTPLDCVSDENSDCFSALTINEHLQQIVNPVRKNERLVSTDISNGKEDNPIRCVNSVDDEDLDGTFTYITKNCYTVDINVDRKITSMQSCQCTGICGQSDSNCACVSLSMQCWYDSNGKLASNFDYRDPPMIFECSDACSCNKSLCYNRCLGKGTKIALKVFRLSLNNARGGGWGVCAAQFIEKGSLVCEYVGEILPGSLAYHRDDDSYLFELEMKDDILQDSVEPYCIDAKNYGNISRLINHKCEPNLVPVRIFVDHQDLHFPRIAFFSSKNINVGEELGFDYGSKFWSIKLKSFACNCNSRLCRYAKRDTNTISDAEPSEVDDNERNETDN